MKNNWFQAAQMDQFAFGTFLLEVIL